MITPILEMIERLFRIFNVLNLHIGCLQCNTSISLYSGFGRCPTRAKLCNTIDLYDLSTTLSEGEKAHPPVRQRFTPPPLTKVLKICLGYNTG